MRQFVLTEHPVKEYMEIFDLPEKAASARWLEYGCGPTSLNALIRDKHRVVSCDPLFQLDKAALKRDVESASSLFFDDYEQGKAEGRYLPITASLPFEDFSFDWALSAYYFFRDLDFQDEDFHIRTICELARVAKEVRIFPLIEPSGLPSALLGPVLLGLQNLHFGVEVRKVARANHLSGNAMLRVWAELCTV